MRLVIDSSIPFVEGIFEPYADVLYKEGPEIQREDVIDADALLIRTRTICDKQLLSGSKVKIIATTTAAMDNIDTAYCDAEGIFYKNALGCNAGAVSNYVFSALYASASRRSIPLNGMSIGIIGLGSTGQRVEDMAKAFGFKVLRYDPYKEQEEWYTQFHSLDDLLSASDIVTIHAPLTEETRAMANSDFFSKMKDGAFFINTAHGDIVVEDALIAASSRLGPIAIDAWSNEPTINLQLLELADIATPHISGYSLQSKQIGSAMAVRAIARYFKLESLYEFFPRTEILEYQAVKLDILDKSQGQITSMVQYNYPIFTDDFLFRTNPTKFVDLRTNYHYRREFFL